MYNVTDLWEKCRRHVQQIDILDISEGEPSSASTSPLYYVYVLKCSC